MSLITVEVSISAEQSRRDIEDAYWDQPIKAEWKGETCFLSGPKQVIRDITDLDEWDWFDVAIMGSPRREFIKGYPRCCTP